jgi:hypothetical protein
MKMCYYIVSEVHQTILGRSITCPDPQKEADYYGCAVYIIEGEHTGMSAEPHDNEPLDTKGDL